MKARVMLIVIFLGIACLAIGPFVWNYGTRLADMETSAMAGKLLPFEIDPQRHIEIQIGGIHVITDMNTLGEGFNLRQILDVGSDYPFQIRLKDSRLLFSVDMRNANNETIATITDNEWGVNYNKVIAHGRNYNSYALEVIDSHLVPVIQIHFTPDNKLYVGGVFYLSNGIMLATNDTTIFNPSPAEINASLPRIFNYPGELHLGEMVVKGTYQVTRASTPIFVIGGVLTGLGILLSTYTGYVGVVALGGHLREKPRQNGKESKTPLSEWRNRTKRVFTKASSRAFAENKGRKKKPDEKQFKKEAISYTEQFALDEKKDIIKKQGATKGAEFYNHFKQVRSHVEKGENEKNVEHIIQKWHEELVKKT